MAVKGNKAKNPVKGGIKRSVKFNCRLCCCPLRSNSENLNISMQNLFKISKRDGFQNGTCQKSEIGLEIER